jgi:hypothetical protein
MTSSGGARWPLVLFLGLCVSLLVGSAVAVAAPSESGRPWWRDDKPERVTGAVVSVDAADRTVTIDGLVTYDPVRAGLGTLDVDVPAASDAWPYLRPGETVDVVVSRHDGTWRATSVVVLDVD